MKANRLTSIQRVGDCPFSVTGNAEVDVFYVTPRGTYKKIRFAIGVHSIRHVTGVLGNIRRRFKELAQQLANDL